MHIQRIHLIITWWFALICLSSKCNPINQNTIKQITASDHSLKIHTHKLVQFDRSFAHESNMKTKYKTLNSTKMKSKGNVDNPDREHDRNRRQNRCLVEAILHSRALKQTAPHYNVLSKSSTITTGSVPWQHDNIKHRTKRNVDSNRAITYFQFHDQQPTVYHPMASNVVPIVGVIPGSNGKVILSSPMQNSFRPVFFTLNGLKVWGDGDESKFGPVLEYFVQRIQSYFSVYKYEDESRPSPQWIFRPQPKPGDISFDGNDLESMEITLPAAIGN